MSNPNERQFGKSSRRAVLAGGLASAALLVAGPAAVAGGYPADGFDLARLPRERAAGAWAQGPVGFAALAGAGLEGTTGGAGGRVVHALDAVQLRAAAAADEPLIVILVGTISLDSYEKFPVASNKTFIGQGHGAELVNGGFKLVGVSNVIFRNFTIRDSYIPGDFVGKRPDNDRDGIQLDTCHHVWVDHMHFTRLGDGLLDTRKDCDFLSYSWNVFADHNKAIGEGWTTNVVTRLTFHHNWIRNTHQRNASLDNTAASHVFNNYLENISGYGMLGRNAAKLVVEGNYFKDVRTPLKNQDPAGELVARNNVFKHCDGDTGVQRGEAFDPSASYDYRLDPAGSVPARVRKSAGPLGGTIEGAASQIRVALDGTGRYSSIRAAIGAVESGNTRPVTITLAAGIYYEPAVIWADRRNITLRGETGRAQDVTVTFKEGVSLWVAGDRTHVADLTVSTDIPQDAVVLRTTGKDVTYSNVVVSNGIAG